MLLGKEFILLEKLSDHPDFFMTFSKIFVAKIHVKRVEGHTLLKIKKKKVF